MIEGWLGDPLAAATSEAGRFLGERLGTVEPGAAADLVLLGGDPLEDVTSTRRIEGAMVQGEWLDRERLDALLAGLAGD